MREDEFSRFMQQYERLVTTVCLQFVHDPYIAEDIKQETFLTAFAAIDRCAPEARKQWLIRVAVNKCKDYLGSAWNRKMQTPGDDQIPEPRGAPPGRADLQSPEELLLQQLSAAQLEELVRGLRQPYTDPAVLYFLEECPVPEIARRLGRPTATVQNQIYRAKLLLRKQIEERRRRE